MVLEALQNLKPVLHELTPSGLFVSNIIKKLLVPELSVSYAVTDTEQEFEKLIGNLTFTRESSPIFPEYFPHCINKPFNIKQKVQ